MSLNFAVNTYSYNCHLRSAPRSLSVAELQLNHTVLVTVSAHSEPAAAGVRARAAREES